MPQLLDQVQCRITEHSLVGWTSLSDHGLLEQVDGQECPSYDYRPKSADTKSYKKSETTLSAISRPF
jgi:hypothetical protein